jgi:hypothetical protein
MITVEELKKQIDFLKENNLVVELFFLFKQEDDIQIKRGRLKNCIQKSLVEELVRPFLEEEIDSTEDIVPYDPTLSPDKKILFEINQSDVEQYSLSMSNDIEDFDDSMGYDDIWGYMIKVSKNSQELVVVRKKFGLHTLKKGFSLWLSGGQFIKFDNNILTLDEHADAVLINGKFYVFQRTNFERCFLFDEKIKVQAERNAKEIINGYKLLVLNEGVNIESYLDKHSISRLRRIDMSLIKDGTMSYQKLIEFCDDFGISITRSDSEKKFMPKDKREFKIFVKLLSDDYLESALTQRKYDVHSKERLSNRK